MGDKWLDDYRASGLTNMTDNQYCDVYKQIGSISDVRVKSKLKHHIIHVPRKGL